MIAVARKRRGFTLLEVLMASAIAILLLGALYVTFDVTVRLADTGRETVDTGNLARNITNRIANDLTGCIGPMQPKSGGGIPVDPSTTSNSTTPAATTTPAAATATPAATATVAGATATAAAATITEGVSSTAIPFQAGVYGSSTQLTLYVSGVPEALKNPETADPLRNGTIDTRPDLRRVIYYMGAGGLCRQVRPWVTADGVINVTDPDPNCDDVDLVSEAITSVTFQYYGVLPDGTCSGWQDNWDGTQTASDGASVLGPPRAIKVTMVIQPQGAAEAKTISQVIPVRAAVGLYVAPAESGDVDPTDPSTSTTGM